MSNNTKGTYQVKSPDKVTGEGENPESQRPLRNDLDPPEPPEALRYLTMSKVLASSSVGIAAAPFIYNASTLAWGIILAASVIGGFVMWLLYKKSTK
ncbi:MAG: hypothetical protein GTO45_00800 [Candidatus Aminicenantes bacterium]|nr:hypothetical protein [Candidatus Aminicenantes bacterium]NIM77301.1 hypothetical protein [Candidatus Aminicenantes bacterium]NIN16602.1 hypothetical protein [Candidatus Aminicenantes bacterium]NIN40460.1 hypothetical protein [Candidatus Aminicenantes bacterium]NIN83280.1 hypothetical protein [Candidatus Aminicenantes bacterium]